MRLWHRYKMWLDAIRQDHVKYKISVGSAEPDLHGSSNVMGRSEKAVDEKILLGTSWDYANSVRALTIELARLALGDSSQGKGPKEAAVSHPEPTILW